jgi:Flp pilus assembly protein TadG
MNRSPKRRIGHLFRRPATLARDERGATAVEFGLLAIPFFGIVMAILETSLIFLSGQVLESAVNDASRAIRTGQVQQTNQTIDDFRANICNRLYGLFRDCSGLHIRVVELGGFESISFVTPVDWNCETDCDWTEDETWSPGVGKSVVLVQVHYKFPVMLQVGSLGMANLPNNLRLMGTATVFQNEPFT